MCGIAGYQGSERIDSLGDAILAQLAHRGPDGSGRHVDSDAGIALFHTRLAILDTSVLGAQPMTDASGSVVIVFNGEIYNFRELRQQCMAEGDVFRSHSDTEVILALYRRHGEAFLSQLNGIFALGLWDVRSRRLLLARDSVGVKPLYYVEHAKGVAFASELKTLRLFPFVAREPDLQAISCYVRWLWCPGPRSPLRGVYKMEPGEALWISDGRIRRRWRFAGLPIPSRDAAGTQVPPTVNDVREALERAVQRQLVADVPVGAFLSGGIDSSVIVALARRQLSGRMPCFTIAIDTAAGDGKSHDGFEADLPYARLVAQQLDLELHVTRIGPEMLEELPKMVWHLDEPQADPAALNTFFICQQARRQGIPVLLSGTGGDDIFGGYRRHLAMRLDGVWARTPPGLRRWLARAGRAMPANPSPARRIGKVLRTAELEGNARVAAYFDWCESENDLADLFEPASGITVRPSALVEALDHMPAHLSDLERMLLLDQRYFLTEHNLNYTDKMSMACGVEVRVPFLDPDLMVVAALLPDRCRVRGLTTKWMLRQAARGLVPDLVIRRSKTGFGAPVRHWLRGPLREMMHELLGAASLRQRGIFSPAAVARHLRDLDQGRGDPAYVLLSLMCIEWWCRLFLDAPPTGLREAA
ncbi:asparagine synthase (glutamine-hydrolyzing) [Tahibacter amnicola]|uniref:asparagine synthase (glutamine-hydrolyzing) n=1 Tax=Tahibacter amnicola TaxID=2976241 RepID=A0ABY6BDH6_9GAMM|nr:asparagine synthase (glutamine-hydrolyzing) [Tahibacter amnicola]UXI66385.1 asparagine synthase (glutamine-hydrolyzing) [Tahibacter amnicola]